MKSLSTVCIFSIVIVLCVCFSTLATENPEDGQLLEYWQTNFTELKADQDPRAKEAHAIFLELINVAGKGPGLEPWLLILVKGDKPVALSLGGGGVIISEDVLDICYKENPSLGPDRLAFTLAHEIAHQLNKHPFHLQSFQGVEVAEEKVRQENKGTTSDQENSDDKKKKLEDENKKVENQIKRTYEFEADKDAIIYASMAGFNTRAIVTDDDNFFEYYCSFLNPETVKKDQEHPAPKKRAEEIKSRLKEVLKKVDLFKLGLLFYQDGEYSKAIRCFEEFCRDFPSREVYHNLASSYHQLALTHYQEWKGEALPFKLTVAVDPETRASNIPPLKGESPKELFKKNIGSAIDNYQSALSLDPSYPLSYNNLACALIVKGVKGDEGDEGDVNQAICVLENALKKIKEDARKKEILNTLGVGFYYDEKLDKAKTILLQARQLDANYDAPLFNLGKLAFETGNKDDAKHYWEDYLKLDPAGLWADAIRKTHVLDGEKSALPAMDRTSEKVMGVGIGFHDAYDDQVEKVWGAPQKNLVEVPAERYRVNGKDLTAGYYCFNIYDNHIMTVSQKNKIIFIQTLPGFAGKTEKNIAQGSDQNDVVSAYGRPSKILDLTQGESWVYDSLGLSFLMRDGKVVSWILF